MKIPWNKGKRGVYSAETLKKMKLARVGYKHTDDWKEAARKRMLGEKNHFYGKKHTPESIERIREDNLKNPRKYWKGKRRVDMLKEKHWWWKGGITPLRISIRECFQYRQWRSDIFTRDDFTCQICGKRGGKINADHIKSFSLILAENYIRTIEDALDCEELWNINNGRTLCEDCHHNTDTFGGKSHKNKKYNTSKK